MNINLCFCSYNAYQGLNTNMPNDCVNYNKCISQTALDYIGTLTKNPHPFISFKIPKYQTIWFPDIVNISGYKNIYG